MTEIPKKRDPFRFRLYYRMMDVWLILTVPTFMILILTPNGPLKDLHLRLSYF